MSEWGEGLCVSVCVGVCVCLNEQLLSQTEERGVLLTLFSFFTLTGWLAWEPQLACSPLFILIKVHSIQLISLCSPWTLWSTY
jgi:hypothetical protein